MLTCTVTANAIGFASFVVDTDDNYQALKKKRLRQEPITDQYMKFWFSTHTRKKTFYKRPW